MTQLETIMDERELTLAEWIKENKDPDAIKKLRDEMEGSILAITYVQNEGVHNVTGFFYGVGARADVEGTCVDLRSHFGRVQNFGTLPDNYSCFNLKPESIISYQRIKKGMIERVTGY